MTARVYVNLPEGNSNYKMKPFNHQIHQPVMDMLTSTQLITWISMARLGLSLPHGIVACAAWILRVAFSGRLRMLHGGRSLQQPLWLCQTVCY